MNRRGFFGALSGLIAGWLGKDVLDVDHLRPYSGPVDLDAFCTAMKKAGRLDVAPDWEVKWYVFDGQKWRDNEVL